MPLHDFQCPLGHVSEHSVPAGTEEEMCFCGRWARKVFLRFPLSRVVDVSYQSPIDGRPITTKAAREEDLARSECLPYDPGMRQDAERRRAASEAAFDRSVEETVEAEIHRMPARKREKLAAELEAGVDAAVTRG